MIYEIVLLFELNYSKPKYECVRWSWVGDVYDRRVVCLEQKKKDCSNRLHKNICRLENKKIKQE